MDASTMESPTTRLLAPRGREPGPTFPPPLRATRILLVDDEPDILESTAALLRLWIEDVELVVASSGHAAMALFHARPFDLVITDLRMPGLDGLAMAIKLRRHEPSTLFVFWTADPDGPEAALVSASFPGASVLSKNGELADLRQTVQSLVLTASA